MEHYIMMADSGVPNSRRILGERKTYVMRQDSSSSDESEEEPSSMPTGRPDNQLAAGTSVLQANCSSTATAVRSDEELNVTVIQNNSSGPIVIGAGNSIHYHYHFHFHGDACGLNTVHTEHSEWAEHQMQALVRGLQRLQLPPCDDVATVNHEESDDDDGSERVTSNQNISDVRKLDKQKKISWFSFIFKKVSKPPETSPLCETEDTVSIIDSKGRVLVPGDAVLIGNKFALYLGDQEIVKCKWKRTGRRVVKKKLDLTEPFGKVTFYSVGECSVYNPKERVAVAMSHVGTVCPVGDGLNFLAWVLTGMTWGQAYDKGLRLQS